MLPIEQGKPPGPSLKNVGDPTPGDYQRQSPTQSDHACQELGGTGPVDQMDEEQNAEDGSEYAERESRSCRPSPRHGPRSRDSVRGGDTDQTRLGHVLELPVCPGPAIVPRRSQGRASALPQSV